MTFSIVLELFSLISPDVESVTEFKLYSVAKCVQAYILNIRGAKNPWIPYLKLEASYKGEELAFRVFCLFLLFSGHLLLHIFILILSFIFVNMSF
jgi:hypothetical protein